MQLGHAYINIPNMDMAFEMYQKTIEFDPEGENAIAYLNLGAIYMNNKKDHPNAIIHFEKYLELASKGKLTIETRQKIQQIKGILRKLRNDSIQQNKPRFSN